MTEAPAPKRRAPAGFESESVQGPPADARGLGDLLGQQPVPSPEPATAASPPRPPPEPAPAPAPVTFEVLARRTGHRAAPVLRRVARLALAAQRARRAAGVNANPDVTRTAALWAVTVLDPEVAVALRSGGITTEGLQEVMRLPKPPEPATVEDAPLAADLITAMEDYLVDLPAGRLVGPAHVAAAVLLAAQGSTAGRLPGRLAKMGATVEAGLAALEPLLRPPRSDHTEWTSDAPASEDHLGRRFLAQALAVRLRRLADPGPAGSRDSYLIHIDGPWGSGKSTLFGFLEAELGQDFLVVPVNAWREQRVGVQWWTLYQALRSALVPRRPLRARTWAVLQGFWDAASTRAFPVVAVLAVTLLVAVAGVWAADRSFGALAALADSLVKVVTFAGLAVGGLAAVRAFLLPDSRRAARGLEEGSANPMQDVRRLFGRALRRAGRRPVVFLVDDLDRCDEEYVVRFLEVVQTLVRDAGSAVAAFGGDAPPRGPYCFVAADGQWLRSSYENHYASTRITEVPGRPLGYLFLEKVFQLQVRLPSITAHAKEAFYASLLRSRNDRAADEDEHGRAADAKAAAGTATSTAELSQVTEDANALADPEQRMEVLGKVAVRYAELTIEAEVESELLPFSRFLEPNPRSMKLFVNSVGIQQSLRALEGVSVPTPVLALWCVIETRWPQLADHLRAHPDHVDAAVQAGGDPGGTAVPPAIRDLLRSAEVREVTTESEWGPLSEQRILLCTGG